MKILYVITGLGQGGAERVVCDIADQMSNKGHDVKIVFLVGKVLTSPVNPEIELIKLNLNNLLSLFSAYLKLSKIIQNFSPDIVHSHMVHANLLCRIVRLYTPIKKLICTAHSNDEGGRLRMLAYRITHNLADLTTNVSDGASKAFIQKKAVKGKDIITTYNGINLKNFFYQSDARSKIFNELNIETDSILILAVGRFNKQKDYPNLLTAFKLLNNETDRKIKLIIAGDGELRREIEDIISKDGLTRDVYLLGRRTDIPELMSAADLFVLSSSAEGFGLVLAEAMACETLVVATDCGGVAEVIGDFGFLVPPQSPIMLSKAMQAAILMDAEKKEIILKNARNRVQTLFSLDNSANRWLKLYKETGE